MMNFLKLFSKSRFFLTGIIATGLLTGCGGSGNDPVDQNGYLTVGFTDAPVDMVDQVRLYVSRVTVKPETGPPVSYPVNPDLMDCLAVPGETDDCNPVDLLSLQDGIVLTVLANQELAAGRYEWLRLDIDEAQSYIVEDAGGIDDIEVRIPSARGLQLSGGFVILAGETTNLVMDWDARQGLTNPMGFPGYILKPSIRVTDLSEYGAVAGTVSDALMMGQCMDTAVVYVFDGDLIPAPPANPYDPAANLDDIDNNMPNPLVTAAVNPLDVGGYGYEVNFLPLGTYTVALTCDIDNVPATDALDDADDVIEFIDPQIAIVEDGQTEEVNF
jgi:hypothetical protein